MDFAQKVKDLAARSKHASQHAMTEEATKTAVVMPFIQALGYDAFNLEEVVPEFIADVGIKKGEKIDFAIKIGGKPAVLIEVKPINMSLGSAQYSQPFRYFATVEARLAILLNGREIWFFSDIDEKNKMDKKPFFVFDLQNYDDRQVAELARFQKANFDMDSILDAASNLKYVKAAATELSKQLTAPDDEFVRFFGKLIYDGTMTKAVVEMLRPAIQSALDEVIRNRIQDRLNVTFGKDAPLPESTEKAAPAADPAAGPEVVTTEDETQAFMIVRAIGSKLAPVGRITMRDAQSYCSIFMDDNNRKPICRLYFNRKNSKSIGIFNPDKTEMKHQIEDLSDIFKHADAIEAAVKAYI